MTTNKAQPFGHAAPRPEGATVCRFCLHSLPKCSCRVPGHTLKTYGVAKSAETEGDLYEQITGQRSAVLDAADAKRKG